MANPRSVDFLPEIFQTSTNRQVLNATLDQMIQEPNIKRIQGFVGRRVGPGVRPNDAYVVEPTATRANYQLEPGVIQTDPANSHRVVDAMTYPGLIDALTVQGGITTNADQLFTSHYYSWDPFVDFDKFVNYAQYYWLPGGPDSVDVFSGGVPTTENFVVTRANGSYTFSNVAGTNPNLTLVRGGTYTFQVAQNQTETVNFRVGNRGTSAWVIDYIDNPALTLVRGNTYTFTLVSAPPIVFYIKTVQTPGVNNLYTNGVTNNGAATGTVTFTVPQDAPDVLYYNSATESNMVGVFNIVDAASGTGSGFWIQTDPGLTGAVPSTPNISGRLGVVNGVTNNGDDLGTITFNVPLSTAQDFYYGLNKITYNNGQVGLLAADLQFDQLNNIYVDQFLAQHPTGIDGITNLNGLTIVFTESNTDPVAGGWMNQSQYDPLVAGSANNGVPGSFDTTTFDQAVPITDVAVQRSVWQIQYVTPVGTTRPYMQLISVYEIPDLYKFTIQGGTQYASTGWYKDNTGAFVEIPLLTATRDILYYQDAHDATMFGEIKLIDQSKASTLDINGIFGKKQYVSPNGVSFTNGLKVTFLGSTNPVSYENNSYYVEGVGTAIQLLPITNFVTPETYTQSGSLPYDSTKYDVGNYDASLNQPAQKDYLTIHRASPDLNPWSRSNRWFHISVIEQSAAYNNSAVVVNNAVRATRPILEYRGGTRLFDFGTQGLQPVDVIDFTTTNSMGTVNGSTGYGVDGYNLITGSRVIFANDIDPTVRDQVYVVEFITPDTVPPVIAEPVIHLVPADPQPVSVDDTVVCLSGVTLQGFSFRYDGTSWIKTQQKTSVNQAPLFDIYDINGVSLSDPTVYPSSNFRGCKLFSYASSDNANDTELGFPIRYLSLANIGDIVFDNNLYVDTFIYTVNATSFTENVSIGSARQYSDRVSYTREIGWQPAAVPSRARQQFRFSYDGYPLQLDVAALPSTVVPSVQLYVNGEFQQSYKYTVVTTTNSTKISFSTATYNDGTAFAMGDIIEVDILSDQASQVGFYQVPVNLENNALNINSPYVTVGTARTHYSSICENLLGLIGPINGNNNTRDLGNIIPYGDNIIQNSSPLTLAGYFLRSAKYNVFDAINYNSREYEQYKARLLNAAVTTDYTNYTIPNMLTAIVAQLIAGRTEISPFYWSDMLPANTTYSTITSTWTSISTPTFNLNNTYNFTSSNYQSVLVYVNDEILQSGYDYEVSADTPTLTITRALSVGDVIVIHEYATTYGTFVPNTPTKLGLYPAFRPQIYLDTTYVTPTLVILGHDGSKTIAFNDFRDQLLLEFETRIFNNLKIHSAVPLTQADVIPGQFRTDTGYSISDINQILAPSFLSWLGWNKLTYTNQDYIATNQFTWNYSASGNLLSSSDGLTESPLPVGAWRGIYQYFYDTPTPQATPWEMLGFSQEPTWWISVYGPGPYTSGNLVLWDDLALGRVADPAGSYILPKYARPNLQKVIPVDSQGELLSPFHSVVGMYDSSQFQKSWTFGDQGPVEYSWRASSAYPFAVMRLLALTRPAEFFSLFADRDLYRYDTALGQYLYNQRYRLDANGLQVYGNGVSKASYIDWIVDYTQQLGINSTTELTTDLAQLDVRLCYRMGTFTDQQYLEIYAEKSSPESTNSTLLIPDNSYNILVYKNQPFNQVLYSSIIVQVVEDGYSVTGYSITNPYFDILASKTTGSTQTITSGNTTVTVPASYTKNVVQIPYGYVFTNSTMVVDFILSYGALMQSQGLLFDNRENGYTLNWQQMAQEFLYWADQGWTMGSIINLNPVATSLTLVTPGAVTDSLSIQTPENIILDQNRYTIAARDLVIDRDGNSFTATSLNNQYISYMALRSTNYESLVILDNLSVFNDLIYDPATGARQYRVLVSASVTADWDGQVNAAGFIYNNAQTVTQWQPLLKYSKGEIVIYKNQYWQAANIVQPASQFDRNNWLPSNYTRIQQGLLQNLALQSNQLANSYDVNQANLQLEQDLFAFGLIGYRPRQYMTDLNLSDISQINLYQELIKDKGTINSVRLLTNAALDNETAQYQVFENWAILRGTYGANANRRYIELQLNESLLTSNPGTVQITAPQQVSVADQTIPYTGLWSESYNVTSPEIFPTTTVTVSDTALPSAGYVNLDDVDITVFDLEGQLGAVTGVLNTIGVGTTVWAAKSTSYDWNVYRATKVPGYINSATPNLNGTTILNFTQTTGLSVGDVVVVRYVSAVVDGVYRVLARTSLTSIAVSLTIKTAVTGVAGLAFSLQTMRVAQASDVVDLPYASTLTPGARAWVDDNGSGQWQVLEKTDPFVAGGSTVPTSATNGDDFGYSIAQGHQNVMAMVGSPGYGTSGGVYTYLKNYQNIYGQNFILTLNAPNAAGYGSSVAIGYQNWAVAGAPSSNSNQGYATPIYRPVGSANFVKTQLLSSPDADYTNAQFGTSVAISQNERWMYVSAPGRNKVYAYGRVDQPTEVATFTATGQYQVYNVAGIIQFSSPSQLAVVLNNRLLTLDVDYAVTGTIINLVTVPLAGEKLIVTRKVEQDFVGDGSTRLFSLQPYLYTATNIYSFTVLVNDVTQVPGVGYTFNSGQQIVFSAAPAVGATIVVLANTYWQFMHTITVSGLLAAARFGSQLATTTDGRQIMIGASGDTVNGVALAGATYVFNRSVTRYIIANAAQTTYALPSGYQTPVAVLLNGQFLTNSAQYINGGFTVSGNNVIVNVPLGVGDTLELESNIFSLVQKITALQPFEASQFGSAVDVCSRNCSIYTGAPQAGSEVFGSGLVQRNVNQAKLYGIITSTVHDPVLTAGDTILVQETPVAVPDAPHNTVSGLAAAIVAAGIPNVTASAANGLLTINIINLEAADTFNKLTVWPGTSGTAFSNLGFVTYSYTQTITSPDPQTSANFGTTVCIDTSAQTLIVGAPLGTLIEAEVFDGGSTFFDEHSTTFFSATAQSGVAYSFDYLPSANGSVTNPGMFVFGQQIYDSSLTSLDSWGTAIDYTTGVLLIGSPNFNDSGRVGLFNNPNRLLAWQVIHQQQPVVDVHLLNSVNMYNRLQGNETYFFDFIDPLQGKILGVARQNINFIGAVDPAQYNTGGFNNNGNFWATDRVGEIWWDTTGARFIDPNQDDIVYASRRWGQLFPGSTVDVYQWISSTVPPGSYTGEGQVYSTTSYSTTVRLNNQGVFETTYYFWTTNVDTVRTGAGKNLSTNGIARYIMDPRNSGIPYIAALDASTIAIYNGAQYLSASDTILHIDFCQILTDANVHNEFQLISDGDTAEFLCSNLYQKYLDSFSGYTAAGAQVPDPFLSPAMQYGVLFSPRQSMYVNRFLALENYLTRTNAILATMPITELRSFALLNSSEPIPAPGSQTYDRALDSIEQLTYQDLAQVPVGYRYLITADRTYGGAWTIYEVVPFAGVAGATHVTQLSRIQNYNTTNYWQYIDWYQVGYNPSTVVAAQVPNYASLATLTVAVGSSVKVLSNSQGKWEIYLRTATSWERVGLESGTIEFDASLWDYTIGRYGWDSEVFDAQYYDQEPVIETRNIIESINYELFIDDLAVYRNQLLILMFQYILSEEQAPAWLTKTSLIDVRHDIRALLPYPVYHQDNQTFVESYIQEVKPYHVQIKDFNLVYNGIDQYPGTLTDFDCPAYYDTALESPQYVSPILLPYTKSTAAGAGTASAIADTVGSAEIWNTTPWGDWFSSYLLSLQSVNVYSGGTGYSEAPAVTIGIEWQANTAYALGQQIFYRNNLYTVTVAGISGSTAPEFTTGSQNNGSATLSWAGMPAAAVANINSLFRVSAITVTNPGSGYTTSPLITMTGGNGTGAQAYAVMGNNLVRDMTMRIKYDRYEYVSNVTDWTYSVDRYPAGAQVRYADRVWQAVTTVTNNPVITQVTGAADAYTVTVNSDVGLAAGMIVTGLNVPAGTTVVQWTSGSNTIVLNRALLASVKNEPMNFYNPFILEDWTLVDAGTLSGVDRTQGFYQPTSTMPGRNLPLLIDGIDYPGVQVYGLDFSYNTGFDVGNSDINPFDNITYGPEGTPTYDPSLLDAVYSGSYSDPFLGTRATDINVDGGGYIDVFSSHAPEELVPGSEFDTLDFRVYTAPGPEHMAFRIFQDMRGVQATYRITDSTTTQLTQPVAASDDVIHVANAAALGDPNLAANFNLNFSYVTGDVVLYAGSYFECTVDTLGTYPTNTSYWTTTAGSANIWGILTVGAERIMYRHRDTTANTVSGLLRGTAGTAAAAHESGTAVYDMGRGNLMPPACQNYIETNVTYPLISGTNLGDGVTQVFVTKIDVSLLSSTLQNAAVEVYLGGIQVFDGYSITAANPLTVTFANPPAQGVEVAILVRRAHSWYNTATPTLNLFETDTQCARFLRGQ